MTQKYYSTSDAARVLRVSRVTIFKRIKSGKIVAEKIGRNYIISHEHLLEALGKSIGKEKKENIDRAVDKAIKDYGEVFRLLGLE